MSRELSEQNFKQAVLENTKPVIVKIYAEWCPPCKQMAPTFEALAKEFEAQCAFYELNVDNARTLAVQLGITSVPTVLYVKNGQILRRDLGYVGHEELSERIQALINAK